MRPDRVVRSAVAGGTTGESSLHAAQAALARSEALFRSVVTTMHDGIVVQGPDGVIVEANPRACEILGLSTDDLNGRTSFDPRWEARKEDGSPFPGDEHPAMVTLRTGAPCRDVLMHLSHPDGRRRAIRINSDLLPPAPDGTRKVFASFADVTDVVEAQRALSQSEARLAGVFGAIDESVAVLRPIRDASGALVDEEITWVNAAWRGRFGWVGRDPIGRRALEILPVFARVFPLHDTVLATGEPQLADIELPDGRWLAIVLTRFGDQLVATSRDVTAHRRAEAAVAAASVALAEAQRIAHVGSWSWDARTGGTTWSDELFRIAGREPAEGAVPPEDRALLLDAATVARRDAVFTESRVSGGAFATEIDLIRPDGTVRRLALRGEPVIDHEGTFEGMRGTVADITELSGAQAAVAESEARYRLLAENASDTISRTSPDGTIEYISEAVERLLGYTPDEIVGRPGSIFLPEPELHRVAEAEQRLIRGTPVNHRMRVRRKDGAFVWCETTARAVLDADGRVLARVAVTRDVTAQVEAEAALETAVAALADAQRIAHVGSWALDLETRVLAWSDEALAIFGIERSADITSRLEGLFAPGDAREFQRRMADVAAGGEPVTFEAEFLRGDGLRRRIATRAEAVRNATGAIVGLRGTIIDATDLRAAQEQMAQAERSRLVGQLAGGVAHDYNNILTGILGSAELLAGSPLLGEQELADVAAIRAGARRAAELTRRLLAYGRRQTLALTALDAGSVVRELLPFVRGVCGELVAVTAHVPEPGPWLRADRVALEQAVLNLVVNAREAMPRGGWLDLRVDRLDLAAAAPGLRPAPAAGRYVAISVTDSGHGITPEVLEHVFEPFFSTKGVSEGAGLGLASVEGTMAQAYGAVSIASEPGQGTTVTLYLPEVDTDKEPSRPARSRSVLPGAGTSLRVLVVDDSPEVLTTIARIVADAGCEVAEASGAAAALEIAGDPERRIDVVLTDVVLPGMGGLELADRILELHPEARVAYMSGYSPDMVFDGGTPPDGRVFIPKPSSSDELVQALETFMGHD